MTVEFGLLVGFFLTLLLSLMEIGSAYWQWNQAAKALQLGVRLAVVSDPVSSDLSTHTGLSSTVEEGDPMPFFERICSASSTGTGQCSNGGTYSAASMMTIVYGRGNTACPTTPQRYPPMCQIFPRIRPQNLIVEYTQTGLGFAGRPGGPLPSITLRLTGLNFNFVVVDSLLGLPAIPMNGLSATGTAEDMRGS